MGSVGTRESSFVFAAFVTAPPRCAHIHHTHELSWPTTTPSPQQQLFDHPRAARRATIARSSSSSCRPQLNTVVASHHHHSPEHAAWLGRPLSGRRAAALQPAIARRDAGACGVAPHRRRQRGSTRGACAAAVVGDLRCAPGGLPWSPEAGPALCCAAAPARSIHRAPTHTSLPTTGGPASGSGGSSPSSRASPAASS
jgi:hypothetical protein